MARVLPEKSQSSFAPSHSFCRSTTFWRGQLNSLAAKVPKPETFDFLGFTHIGGTNGTKGEFVVWRKGRIKE
jgi:hypothetical protein